MTNPDARTLIERWIGAANTHDAEQFLSFFVETAVLDDPSVGETFHGREGIKRYFDAYFIGYNTRTRVVDVTPRDDHLHVEVHFVGDFPGGEIGGTFDVTLADRKIAFVTADLV